jgi:hypothetical protein
MRDSVVESLTVYLNHESHAWAAAMLPESTRAQLHARPESGASRSLFAKVKSAARLAAKHWP